MRSKTESFNDRMSRLFPSKKKLARNSGGCRQLTLQVTENCNLACTYCYQIHKTSNRMSFETAKKAIDCLFSDNDKIKNYYDNTKLTSIVLEFIGGEPLLEVELIDKIMEYFLSQAYLYKSVLGYRYMISLCSNGVLYYKREVQNFIKKWRNHLSLTISLDGCQELHDKCRVFSDGRGSYALAEKAALEELKLNPSLSTKMTLAPENIIYFKNAIVNLINLGYSEIHCNCIFEKGWTIKHAKQLYEQGKELSDYLINNNLTHIRISFFDETIGQSLPIENNRNWCGGAGLMLAIDYKGDFYPCLRYMESSLGEKRKPYRIGDLENGIGQLKIDKKHINCLDCITRRSQSNDECFYCPIASGCAWCSAYNYEVYGTPNKRTTYICIMHKVRTLINSYYWNVYYKKYNINKTYKINLPDNECLKIIDKDELKLLRYLEKGE